MVLLLLGLFVYRDFVFGDKVLLYKATGSDSINDYYPFFAHLSDYLRESGPPSWSFGVGMGQSLLSYFGGGVILSPVAWLPKALIAEGLVYQQLVKLVAIGLLFSAFLSRRGLTTIAAHAGGTLLAFSAFVSIGACWPVFTDEVLLFAFLLFSVEAALSGGRWVYFPFAVAGMSLLGAFHVYLCALLLVLYVPARLIEKHGWQPKSIVRVCVRLMLVAWLGVGLGAVAAINSALSAFDSPRGSGAFSFSESLSERPVLGLESGLHYLTALVRPFSNDMLGTGDDFAGWTNYLEAPVLYCGILCLLLLPQVFVGARARERWIHGVQASLIVVPILFPWFRYLFWFFEGDYYRTFALFAVLWVITMSMTAFSRFIETGKISALLLAGTWLALMVGLVSPRFLSETPLNSKAWITAVVALAAYGAVFLHATRYGKPGLSVGLVLVIAAVEIVTLNTITVAGSETVTKQDLERRTGYNDHTVEAVRYIRQKDDGFFRVTKTYASSPANHIGLNDALVFGYNGTASYHSFNKMDYISFLEGMDIITPDATEDPTRWALGLHGRPFLLSFACEKYLLTHSAEVFLRSGLYEPVEQFDGTSLLRNKAFVPFGTAYHQWVDEEDFRKLPTAAKDLVLFDAVVIGRESKAGLEGMRKLDGDEAARLAGMKSIASLTGSRPNAALKLTSHSQTRFEGTISLSQPGVIVFQMPFDRFWSLNVDGSRVPTFRVDLGLTGAAVPAGEHEITLVYRQPYGAAGWATALACLIAVIVGARRWPVLETPE